MKRLIFVCTVNRWRSPMAEYLFRNLLERTGGDLLEQKCVSSAGIIPENEKERLLQKGLDLPEPLHHGRTARFDAAGQILHEQVRPLAIYR